MSLNHPRWLWLLATALAAASLATSTALASEPDEDDEDDGDAPALILPAAPVPAAPTPAAPAPAPAASAPVASAPVVRGTQRGSRPRTVRHGVRRGRPDRARGDVRPVVHVTQNRRHRRTSGIAVRTVPRGGVQAGAGGMAADPGANPMGLLACGLVLLAAGGIGVRRPRNAT
jgi:hypothetical protein